MNILMTGATGFIGRDLVKNWISSGHTVTAWVRRQDKAQKTAGARGGTDHQF